MQLISEGTLEQSFIGRIPTRCVSLRQMKEATHEALMLELGCTNMLHVDVVGYSQRMIMLWKDHEVAHVDPIAVTNQENIQVGPTSHLGYTTSSLCKY